MTLRVPVAPINRLRTPWEWEAAMDGDLSPDDLADMSALVDEGPFPAYSDELSTPPPLQSEPSSVPGEALAGDYDGVMLPGQRGLGAGCGDLVKVRCRSCGAVFDVEHGCGLRTCPRCYRKWARREGREATRITLDRFALEPGDRLVHAVVSIPGEPSEVFDHRRRVIKIAKRHGVHGFALMGHHVRDGPDGALEVDGYLHYHIIGAVGPEGFLTVPDLVERDFLEHTSGITREGRVWSRPDAVVTGTYDWVFKVIRHRRGRNGWTYWLHPKALYRRFFYCLEHASIADGRHALTWCGEWWNRRDVRANQIGMEGEPEGVRCPNCNSDDVEFLDGGAYYTQEHRYRDRRRPPRFEGMGPFMRRTLAGGGVFEPPPGGEG